LPDAIGSSDRKGYGESQSDQVLPGGPFRDPEGDVAVAPRNRDHDHDGFHHVRDCRRLLPVRGSGDQIPCDPRARHWKLAMGTAMGKRWYIVHAYSNFEKKVAESIREQVKQRHLEPLFDEIMVPTEKVVEVRRGRKVDAERKFFPGYVLVKMDLTDEA